MRDLKGMLRHDISLLGFSGLVNLAVSRFLKLLPSLSASTS